MPEKPTFAQTDSELEAKAKELRKRLEDEEKAAKERGEKPKPFRTEIRQMLMDSFQKERARADEPKRDLNLSGEEASSDQNFPESQPKPSPRKKPAVGLMTEEL